MRKHTHIICYLIALSGLSACSSTHFGNDQGSEPCTSRAGSLPNWKRQKA